MGRNGKKKKKRQEEGAELEERDEIPALQCLKYSPVQLSLTKE